MEKVPSNDNEMLCVFLLIVNSCAVLFRVNIIKKECNAVFSADSVIFVLFLSC